MSLLFIKESMTGDKMKTFFGFLAGAILTICMFFVIKHIDFVFLNILYANGHSATEIDSVKSFQGYSDFVTVITGILALIIGSTGFAAILSYKELTDKVGDIKKVKADADKQLEENRGKIDKFKEEADSQLANKLAEINAVKDEANKIRDELASYARIQHASSLLSSEAGKSSAIDVLNGSVKTSGVDAIFHRIKGDAYYYRGKNGDYNVAIEQYEKALKFNEELNSAWFGLGQVKYKSVCQPPFIDKLDAQDLKLDKVASFTLSNTRNIIKDDAVVREAIMCMEKAVSYGYGKVEADVEMGKMFNDIEEYGSALSKFKNAYDLNPMYTAGGFYYCHLWIVTNQDKLRKGGIDKKVLEELVDKLKFVGFRDLYNGKAAYALLWYLYSAVPVAQKLGSKSDAENALKSTDQYTINDLFKGSVC